MLIKSLNMKKTIYFLFSVSLSWIVCTQYACKKEGCGESNISYNNQSKSHNMGQNCMNCHNDGGSGKGCFNIAGTVYSSNSSNTTKPNGTIKLYTGPNASGTLKATIQIDAKGNFHSTDAIDFSSEVYPVVYGSSGNVQCMPSGTKNGACNSCHGSNGNKIWVN